MISKIDFKILINYEYYNISIFIDYFLLTISIGYK